MSKTRKTFDCVEMKRAGSLRIYEETKYLTLDEEIAYWNKRSKEMLRAIESAHTIDPNFLTIPPKPSTES